MYLLLPPHAFLCLFEQVGRVGGTHLFEYASLRHPLWSKLTQSVREKRKGPRDLLGDN